ncbi:NADPH-dependent FMN reductase [Amycolatopsis jiangsuensis]|uniref:NAD(P)H-dependent FMN reductase n=1 Tax=Amycolatopsis jiangsuensis TaxID=1181879 RepID=A0A840IXH1_9PSEU|nr:NADPH-dependent FMN reductase [Amycolatopsis jiangsuensis]MBB4687521.1 NAD(P)H-dependent FMN reductase [Amycolatopsis jiangsuensis]
MILLISGSLRAGSGNSAVLGTATEFGDARIYDGMDGLPHFNPDHDREPLPAAVVSLREEIRAADAVLFCTPEYAGGLPGAFKNLLDWTIGGGELYGKPVAWINASSVAAPTGGADAHESLRKVLTYAGTRIIDEACARIPVPRDAVADGRVIAPDLRDRIAAVVRRLAESATPASRSANGQRPPRPE